MSEMVLLKVYNTEGELAAARDRLANRRIESEAVGPTEEGWRLMVYLEDVADAEAAIAAPVDLTALPHVVHTGNAPELVALRTYSTEMEAEMARGLLESEGITVFPVRSNAGGWYTGIDAFGVTLLVPEDEVADARDVLGIDEDE
jgi:hypothetical protein